MSLGIHSIMNETALRLPRAPIIEAVLDIDCDLPPMLDLASIQETAFAVFKDIGAAIGFFVGLLASIILLVVFKGEYLFLIPLPILGGIFLGRFIGNALTRAK